LTSFKELEKFGTLMFVIQKKGEWYLMNENV